jgi:hypothetical protein
MIGDQVIVEVNRVSVDQTLTELLTSARMVA